MRRRIAGGHHPWTKHATDGERCLWTLELGRVFNLVVNRAIKASGDVRYPLLSIMFIQWIIVLPLALFFGDFLGLGVIGIWIALALDEAIRGLNLWLRWRGLRWQRKAKKLFYSMANHHEE